MLGDASITEESLKRLQSMILNFCTLENGTLKNDIDLRRYALDAGEVINNSTVQELASIHPNLLRLDVTQCKQISDVGVWAIARHCVGIEHLIMYGCDKVTNVGIRSLSLRCSKLITLDMSLCTQLDDVTLTVVAAGAWKIQYIYFKNCAGITDNGITKVAQGLGVHLKILDLAGCTQIGDFGDRGLKEIGANCTSLRELYYTHARRVEDAGLHAIATGCSNLQILVLGGLHNMTKKGFNALCKHCMHLKQLALFGMQKVVDRDFEALHGSQLQQCLTSLDLKQCAKLGDRGIAAICQAVGGGLVELCLSECRHITDYSMTVVSNLCTQLRALDLTYCGKITDVSVHSLARRVTCLTKLQLDGNGKVTTKALLSHIDKDLEFVEMANKWLGYQPKGSVEELIKQKEKLKVDTSKAIKIQSVIRKKFAMRIYWARYRSRLMNVVIPWFQAVVRGVIQRKRFAVILHQVHCTKMAIRIQATWRKYYASVERIKKIQRIRLQELRQRLAVLIQKRWRGMKTRKVVLRVRDEQANSRLERAKRRAIEEVQAIKIQRVYHGWIDKRRVYQMAVEREEKIAYLAFVDRRRRLVQRIARGWLGRCVARQRRQELYWKQHCWKMSIECQRVYRGLLGRRRWQYFFEERVKRIQNEAAAQIQRTFRGYRGKILGAIARALKILRTQHQKYAVEIQRFLRGCIGRIHFKLHKDVVLRRRREFQASMHIQRLYRGHKGREAREIEAAVQAMEAKAKPLILLLKHAEERSLELSNSLSRLEWEEGRLGDELEEIEMEMEHCLKTTQKFTDSSRINNTPQRFLTKFLKVRLKDFLEHQTELYRVKQIQVGAKRSELRDSDREVDTCRRELIPLTTGLIYDVKRRRAKELRKKMTLKKTSATRIQQLWRRALVLSALWDDHYSGWVRRWNKDQSDSPFYLNIESNEILWTKPLAYNYFGDLDIRADDDWRP